MTKRVLSEKEKVANRERMRLRRSTEEGKQKHREESRLYRERHPDRVLECNRRYYAKNPDKIRLYRREYCNERTLTVIQEKGGKCEVCGFDNLLALELHHINGKEKRERGHAKIAISYPKETLRLLCANCHAILHHIKKESEKK